MGNRSFFVEFFLILHNTMVIDRMKIDIDVCEFEIRKVFQKPARVQTGTIHQRTR